MNQVTGSVIFGGVISHQTTNATDVGVQCSSDGPDKVPSTIIMMKSTFRRNASSTISELCNEIGSLTKRLKSNCPTPDTTGYPNLYVNKRRKRHKKSTHSKPTHSMHINRRKHSLTSTNLTPFESDPFQAWRKDPIVMDQIKFPQQLL